MTTEHRQPVRHLDLAFDADVGNSTDKHILLHMARKGNTSGLCWLSINKLAEAACMSRSTVERSLRRLKRRGWITDVSCEFPTRITKTYWLNLNDRRAAQTGHYDGSTYVDRIDETHHFDAQNLKNPNSESKGQCRSENLLKTKQRRGAPVSAGTLVSQLLNAFSSP